MHTVIKCSVLVGMLFFMQGFGSEPGNVLIHINTAGTSASPVAPMKLFIGVLGSGRQRPDCARFVQSLEHCLTFEKRFSVASKILENAPLKKEEITALFGHGYDAALYVTFEDLHKPVEWRLYETKSGEMVSGKRLATLAYVKDAAYGIACRVIEELMAQKMPFLTKIAFVENDKKNKKNYVMVVDFDGASPQVLFSSRRVVLDPSWSLKIDNPYLVLSEFTPTNVRLVAIDMEGRKFVVFDQPGTIVGISYRSDGKEVVYCRSGNIWHYVYDEKTCKGVHHRVFEAPAVSASPSVLPNGDIIYCAGGKIRLYVAATGKQLVLTPRGYNVAPAYSMAANQVIYSSRINGVMQLFVYDLQHKTTKQLTFGKGDKTDPCWSPCGIYVAFCFEQGAESRIAIINKNTKEYWFITAPGRYCRSPSWSTYFNSLILA
ncbi:MAG: Protein TolB [candidate division TM6 bacterium GW2011_GWE2_42_60]|nr:MAG: Protein TolB [candidate division TM6 bacterium GW2011_GWE2_42_60]